MLNRLTLKKKKKKKKTHSNFVCILLRHKAPLNAEAIDFTSPRKMVVIFFPHNLKYSSSILKVHLINMYKNKMISIFERPCYRKENGNDLA
jgi:hypothetical protein